jgi:uncharacterized membrane protein
VPVFIPPVVAAATALLLSRQSAPSLAYISGSLGTLIGADLLNLGTIQELGAPIASIGGSIRRHFPDGDPRGLAGVRPCGDEDGSLL